MTLAVCTVIQNPAAKLMRNMDLVDCLFDVLGQLCSRYEEQPGVINRLMPVSHIVKLGDNEGDPVVNSGIDFIDDNKLRRHSQSNCSRSESTVCQL